MPVTKTKISIDATLNEMKKRINLSSNFKMDYSYKKCTKHYHAK